VTPYSQEIYNTPGEPVLCRCLCVLDLLIFSHQSTTSCSQTQKAQMVKMVRTTSLAALSYSHPSTSCLQTQKPQIVQLARTTSLVSFTPVHLLLFTDAKGADGQAGTDHLPLPLSLFHTCPLVFTDAEAGLAPSEHLPLPLSSMHTHLLVFTDAEADGQAGSDHLPLPLSSHTRPPRVHRRRIRWSLVHPPLTPIHTRLPRVHRRKRHRWSRWCGPPPSCK